MERHIEDILSRIAKDKLQLPTLETRESDTLNFHDVAVWNIKAALAAAYEAGRHASEERTVRFMGMCN